MNHCQISMGRLGDSSLAVVYQESETLLQCCAEDEDEAVVILKVQYQHKVNVIATRFDGLGTLSGRSETP